VISVTGGKNAMAAFATPNPAGSPAARDPCGTVSLISGG
jgi:hypothetical protein